MNFLKSKAINQLETKISLQNSQILKKNFLRF